MDGCVHLFKLVLVPISHVHTEYVSMRTTCTEYVRTYHGYMQKHTKGTRMPTYRDPPAHPPASLPRFVMGLILKKPREQLLRIRLPRC